MRNLKKILALVLALVMSLSLMATASAADFGDASSISDNYKTAVNVLSQLEVFKGYAEDGTFRPQGEITRAEVATIIYRIATGDAKDAQASIYTNMTTSFTDLDKAEWARGYVNYCHNAQIIKGESATKFNPNGKITGYATLAMILRAMGYGRNGEFEGSQWEITTAAKAKEIGLIDNVIEAQLGANAPRELVAEILFRALLTEMVDYTVLNGYVKNGKTLGYENFKLEELEGVVVANEFANLYGTSVLGADKTNFEVAKDDIRSLNIGTEITDIGMRQHAYITGPTVLDITDADLNKVTETGAATDIRTASKFSATAEMSQGSGTEFYTNFGRSGYNSSDYRIEYEMSVALTAAQLEDYADAIARVNVNNTVNAWFTTLGNTTRIAVSSMTTSPDGLYHYVFHRVIPVCAASALATSPASQIDAFDMNNIRSIFYRSNGRGWTADNDQSTNSAYVGRVYVATQTSKDISDEISYNEFVDKYIKDVSYEISWGTSSNGAWVKFIDNDLDGVCDYAFKTVYTMDEAMGTYTKGDKTYVEYNSIDEEHDTIRYMGDYTPAVGDVVLASLIDGQYLVEKANDVTKTVNTYNWKEDQITTTDGDTYGQSGNDIGNATGMQQLIRTMADKTEYIMYFDHFGYVRAYELPGGTQYALLTEIYAQNNATGSVIQNWPMTVELKAGEEATAEYSLGSGSNGDFIAKAPWSEVNSLVSTGRYYNWLQPAIAHLGVTRTGFGPVRATPSFAANSYYTFWSAWYQYVKGGIVPGVTDGKLVSQEFNYGTQYIGANNAKQDNTVSFTNVAAVNINDKTATLKGAAQLRLNSAGNPTYFDLNNNGQFDDGVDEWRYAVDYVQLTRDNVVAKQTMYKVNDNYSSWSNKFVNATHDTEYYIVHNNGVEYFKDYVNMPKLDADNYIHAAYAVARDTSSDSAKEPYWVADVIVYEVRDYTDLTKTNISLAYYNESRTSDQVQLLKTLTNAKNGPMADLTPAVWNTSTLAWSADRGHFGNYAGYGFYQLWNATEVDENGAMTARKIEKITKDFNKNGIYAGYVDRVVENAPNGGYITINVYDNSAAGYTAYSVSVTDNVYTITTDTKLGGGVYNEANKIRYTNLGSNQVHTGDLVIWQGSAPTAANWVDSAYIVDLGNPVNTDSNWSIFTKDATFLLDYVWTNNVITNYAAPASNSTGLWQQIVWEQSQAATTTTYNVVVERELADGTKKFDNVTLASGVLNGGTVNFDLLTGVTPEGYAPVEFTATAGTLSTTGGTTTTSTSTHVVGSGFTAASLNVTSSANVKVVIKYAPVTYTVKHNTVPGTWGNGIAGIEAKNLTKTPNGAYTALSANGTSTVLSGANVGDVIQLKINLTGPFNAATQDLIVTVTNDGVKVPVDSPNNGENACYFTFTMKADDAVVDAEIQNKATTITATGAATYTWTNATATPSTSGNATTRWPSNVMVRPAVATGYTITGVVVKADGVTMTGGGVDYNWDNTDLLLLATGRCYNKNVTIEFTTTATPADLKFVNDNNVASYYRVGLPTGVTNEANISADVAGFQGTGIAGTTGGTATDTTVDVTVADVVYVLVVNGGTPTATGATQTTGQAVANSGSNVIWKFIPDGTGAALEITVTAVAP